MNWSTLIVLLFLCFISNSQQIESSQFSIEKLAPGVYAAIATNGSFAICNAGIIDLGDETLIFDPFMTPVAAKDLKRVAEKLTGHKVKFVVNSHYHNDHIGGNQVFDDAIIISTEKTRDLIAKNQQQEIAEDKTEAPKAYEKIKQKNTSKMSSHELDEHRMWSGYYQALAIYSDSLITVLPNQTFSDQMSIHGKNSSVQLISYGIGHTESDLFMYLPDQKIAFLGDLLFIQNQPWLGDGDPVKWASYLDRIKLLNPEILVPGHGPIGKISDIDGMKSYFKIVQDAATKYIERKISPENDSTLMSPGPYNNWFLSNFYKPNVISEYHRLLGRAKD